MSLRGKLVRGGVPFFLALLLAACAGEYPQSIFRPASDFARELDGLFMMIFWWTLGILVITEAVLLYIVFRYRRRSEDERPKPIHGHTGLEIVWTLIPAVIIVIIAVPTVRQIFASYQPAKEGTLIIEAVGHQWWWEFRYPELGVVTANEMHIPAGRPVQVKLSSADVLHNFWFPRLAGKRYNYPIPAKTEGESHEGHELFNILTFTADSPGVYLGQCAEYCGTSHAIMRMRAVAHTPEDFQAWAASIKGTSAPAAAMAPSPAGMQQPSAPVATPIGPQPAGGDSAGQVAAQAGAPPVTQPAAPYVMPAPTDPLEAEGKRVFESKVCIACHAVAGTNARGVIGPNLTRLGSRWTIGAGALPMSRENLEKWIHDPRSVKPGTLMPGTKTAPAGMAPTNLTDAEVRAIAAYLYGLK